MKKTIVLSMATLVILSCARKNHFLGEIQSFSTEVDSITVEPKAMNIPIPHSDMVAVYDTLMVIKTLYQNQYNFEVYNIKTMCGLGKYLPRGHGYGEFVEVNPIIRFYTENGDLKTLLQAPNESKLITWNISKSLKEQKTIIDDIVPYQNMNEQGVYYSRITRIGSDTLLSYLPSSETSVVPPYVSDEKGMVAKRAVTLPEYQLTRYSLKANIGNISPYANPINNFKTRLIPDNFFSAFSCIKPDGKKMVEAMCYLPQINIIDIWKNKIEGFRLKGGEDFSIFETDMKRITYYFSALTASDKYIFALWNGKELEKFNGSHMLCIFDWNGKMVKKVNLQRNLRTLWVDTTSDILYGAYIDDNNVYCYTVSAMDID